jgi:hypothetical protein
VHHVEFEQLSQVPPELRGALEELKRELTEVKLLQQQQQQQQHHQ